MLNSMGNQDQRMPVHPNRLHPKVTDRVYCNLSQLRDHLQKLIASEDMRAGETVIDFGCGTQPYRSLFQNKFKNYLGADLEENPDAELHLTASGGLPISDGSADCVLSSQVLEHVSEPHDYLRESFRVLRPGASLLLSTHGIWPYHPHPHDFWRWTREGLSRQITAAGFEVITIKSVFGAESVALQLWQDSTFERLPRIMRPAYTGFFQALIWLIERRHPDKVANDASVYIVLARKPAPPVKI